VASTVIRSSFPDVDIPDVPYHEFVLADADGRGDHPALIEGPTGRTISYRELAAQVRRCAAGLTARGLRKGDVVAIFSPNTPEYVVAFYGVSMAGGIATTVNSLYTVEELAFQLEDASARFLICAIPFLDRALDAADKTGVEQLFVFGEGDFPGATAFAELLATDAEPPRVQLDPARDLVALPYSSGTTGAPKGVMLTHRNLVANLCQTEPVTTLTDGASERVSAILPFYHSYGLTVLMGGAVWFGATLVTMPLFDLDEYLREAQEYQLTRLFVVPPIVLGLARHPAVGNYDLSTVRSVISGAAPLGADLEQAASERLGTFVSQGYGLTETSPVLTTNLPDQFRQGSVGLLIPNTECRVVDPATGDDLDPSTDGELCFRGPQVMKGYLNRPDETAAMLSADGWLRTGDIGHVDADGYLYVVDRAKELIKYKGHQVAPAELEGLLLTHPKVADVAVVRFLDPERGEIPKAFVVVRQGEQVNAEEIMDFVAARVAPHKKVRRVEFIDQIPKALSGKILRRVLIERDAMASG
jgi:acyl-CoA synthetase (AMP-forming)/AMP-acid ligase II